jgi:hypothetical protein
MFIGEMLMALETGDSGAVEKVGEKRKNPLGINPWGTSCRKFGEMTNWIQQRAR